jgi:WD40 repeat protein
MGQKIAFACAGCGKLLRVEETLVGKKIRCLTCRHITQVPAEAESSAPPIRAHAHPLSPAPSASDSPLSPKPVDPPEHQTSAQAVADETVAVANEAPADTPREPARRGSQLIGGAALALAGVLILATMYGLRSGRITFPWGGGGSVIPSGTSVAGADSLDPAEIPTTERFDWQPKELVAVLGEHSQRHWGNISGVVVSHDGTTVTTSGLDDGCLRMWDAATLKEVKVVPHVHSLTSLTVLGEDDRLLFAAFGHFGMFQPKEKPPLKQTRYPSVDGRAYGLVSARDGQKGACSTASGTVYLLDLSGSEVKIQARIEKVMGTAGPRGVVGLSSDGQRLAYSSASDKTVRLLDVSGDAPKEVASLPHPAIVFQVRFSPDGKLLATGCSNGLLTLWDLSAAEPRKLTVLEVPGEVFSLAFSPDGNRLASAYTNVWVWDIDGPAPSLRATFPAGYSPTRIAFSPDGQALFTGSQDGRVRRWDLSGEKPRENPTFPGRTYHRFHGLLDGNQDTVLLSVDGANLLAATGENVGCVWDLSGRGPRQKIASPPALSFPYGVSGDGRSLVAADIHGNARLWNLSGWPFAERRLTTSPQGVRSNVAVFSPDGKVLYVADRMEKKIRIWDVTVDPPGEQPAFQLPLEIRGLTRLRFSPDSRLLVGVDSPTATVYLWDTTDGLRERAKITRSTIVWDAALSPDGRSLVCTNLGEVAVYDISGPAPALRQTFNARGASWGTELPSAIFIDGEHLVLASHSTGIPGRVVVVNASTGAELRRWDLPGPVEYLTATKDGRHLFLHNSNGTIYVLRLNPPLAPGKS